MRGPCIRSLFRCFGNPLHRAMNGCPADPHGPGNGRYHCAGIQQIVGMFGSLAGQLRRSTASTTPRFRCDDASFGALADDGPFKFRDRPENVEDEPPTGRTSVDRLGRGDA